MENLISALLFIVVVVIIGLIATRNDNPYVEEILEDRRLTNSRNECIAHKYIIKRIYKNGKSKIIFKTVENN